MPNSARTLISIHAPSRERPCCFRFIKIFIGFQSTLPCGSDLVEQIRADNKRAISIHAPLRERRLLCGVEIISTLFQSTLPRGSDNLDYYKRLVTSISIHAPSRERQQRHLKTHCARRNFNPRSLAGATQMNTYLYELSLFQSTLPRGSDITLISQLSFSLYFNPRSLAGATGWGLYPDFNASISIHAPSRERPNYLKGVRAWEYFNPRSLAGATLPGILGSMLVGHFNPRSLAGATIR